MVFGWNVVAVMSFVPGLCSVCIAFVLFVVFGSYLSSCLMLIRVCILSS